MIFSVDDWILQVDVEKTLQYSRRILSDHCQCGYCRNYYSAIDSVHPQLRPFLQRFGSHVETPDELMPFEPTVYEATYCICGSVLQYGAAPMVVGKLTVTVAEDLDFVTECPQPCFGLITSVTELPWVLDEDMDEVVSPANEPEYMQRMWNKLLQQAPDDHTFS